MPTPVKQRDSEYPPLGMRSEEEVAANRRAIEAVRVKYPFLRKHSSMVEQSSDKGQAEGSNPSVSKEQKRIS